MPKFYTFDFNEIDNNKSQTLDHSKYIINKISYAVLNSILFATALFLIMTMFSNKEKKEVEKIALFSALLFFLFSFRDIFNNNRYLVKPFQQGYLHSSHDKIILDSYRFIQATHPDILDLFLHIKHIGSSDQFIEYFKQHSKKGLCTGYTYGLLKQVANNPKAEIDTLSNSIDMFDVVRNQLIMHVATVVGDDFSSKELLHTCCEQCTCRKAEKLLNETYSLPSLFTINSFAGTIENFKLEKSADTLYDLYNDHLSSLGFVPKEKLKKYGNPPSEEILDDEVITEDDKNELKNPEPHYIYNFFKLKEFRNKLIKKKTDYIKRNTETMNLEKFTIAGEISIKQMGPAHSMFYRFQRNSILFFDSNHGFYLFPSTKTFCNGLKEHISKNYKVTESVDLKTFAFHKKK